MKWRPFCFVCCNLLGLSALFAAPSVVVLDSGEQLIGEVLPQSTETTLVMQSTILGTLTLPRTRVVSVQAKAAAASLPPVVAVQATPPERPLTEVGEMDEAQALSEERKLLATLKNFKAPEDWSGTIRMGINLSQGDHKWAETYMRGTLEIKPKQSPDFYRFSGTYNYRQNERSDGKAYKSTDKYDAGFIYRRTFQEDWFVQHALGYRADQIKNIQREAQATVGIGYRYKPSDSFDILFGGGGGVEEFAGRFEDTRSGLNPLTNIFQEATWRPLHRTSFVQKFNYYWNPIDPEQFNYLFSAAIRFRLTDLLGFEFSYYKSFDNDVGDGNAQDDAQWRNALVVYF